MIAQNKASPNRTSSAEGSAAHRQLGQLNLCAQFDLIDNLFQSGIAARSSAGADEAGEFDEMGCRNAAGKQAGAQPIEEVEQRLAAATAGAPGGLVAVLATACSAKSASSGSVSLVSLTAAGAGSALAWTR